MATTMKRFTISITKDMEIQLDRMKQSKYYNTTRNKMIQDLICLGLESMQQKMNAIGQINSSAGNEPRAEPQEQDKEEKELDLADGEQHTQFIQSEIK